MNTPQMNFYNDNHEPNPYLRKLNQIQDARVRWAYSEWLINFLRTEGSDLPKIPTDEELMEWMRKQ